MNDAVSQVKWGRAVFAGLAVNLASFLVGGGGYFLFARVFMLEPASIWRWTPDKINEMSSGWWAYLTIGNTLLAVAVALVYGILYHGIPGRGLKKGLVFGLMVWLVGVLPAAFTMHALTVINDLAILYFTIQGLVEYLIYGTIIALIYGEPLRVSG